MKVKVCGMRSPQNIADVAVLRPDYMGFIFYEKSPRYAGDLSPDVLDILPASTARVGVFVDADERYIREIVVRYDLDLVQLHGAESPLLCARLRDATGVIKAFGIGGEQDFENVKAYEGSCDYYLFDTKVPTHGGSGRKFDHRLLSAYEGQTPYLLSGGLGPDDASSLRTFDDARCAGLDINSRFETGPGIKDASAVKTFIETIKNAKR